MPKVIFLDNARGFRAASSKVMSQFGPLCPEWKFIAPKSPWWGGWWERLVRSTKNALKKSVGINALTRAELETIIHEIEGCINSRPLTYVSGEIVDTEPLTPAHLFLKV